MIRLFWGPMGEGKSYNTFFEVVQNLRSAERMPVVTNLPIVWDKLEKLINETDPSFVLEDWVRKIGYEESKQFYTYTVDGQLDWQWQIESQLVVDRDGKRYDMDSVKCNVQRDGRWVVQMLGDLKGDEFQFFLEEKGLKRFREPAPPIPPTMYVLDEFWAVADARSLKRVEGDLDFFVRQHRKNGCECIIMTQHPSDVPKAIRNLIGEFVACVNHKHKKLFTVFKRPPVFQLTTFTKASPGPGSVPLEKKFRKLDLKIANAYKTQAGIGISGAGAADTKKKVKGFSLIWLPVLAVIMIAMVMIGMRATTKALAHAADKKLGLTRPVASVPVPAEVRAPAGEKPQEVLTESQGTPDAGTDPERPAPKKRRKEREKEETPEEWPQKNVYVTGWIQFPTTGEYRICFSDGEEIHTPDHRLQAIGERGVIVNNKLVKFAPTPSKKNANR